MAFPAHTAARQWVLFFFLTLQMQNEFSSKRLHKNFLESHYSKLMLGFCIATVRLKEERKLPKCVWSRRLMLFISLFCCKAIAILYIPAYFVGQMKSSRTGMGEPLVLQMLLKFSNVWGAIDSPHLFYKVSVPSSLNSVQGRTPAVVGCLKQLKNKGLWHDTSTLPFSKKCVHVHWWI